MWCQLPDELAAIDAHNHVRAGADGKLDVGRAEALLQGCSRLGIDRIAVSVPYTDSVVAPERYRVGNEVVWQAMQHSPRFIGFCFVDAHDPTAALAEIEHCIVERKMAGVKLYHQFFVDADEQRPVMEKAASLGVPVLMHAGKCTDPATMAAQPRLSNAGHFRAALEKYPETILIQGHIGGGGDWEWNLRTLEGIDSGNYYIDLSGSVIDAGIVRRSVDTVGCERLLFATDGSLEEGVGKLLAAGLSMREMRLICHDNFARIMARRKVCDV